MDMTRLKIPCKNDGPGKIPDACTEQTVASVNVTGSCSSSRSIHIGAVACVHIRGTGRRTRHRVIRWSALLRKA